MKYALAIYAPPGPTASTAFQFAKTLLEHGHELQRLFFFSDGVLNCAADSASASAEAWSELVRRHRLDAVVCIRSAHKRELFDATTARQRQLGAVTLASEFQIGGLGQLIDAGVHADRLITFA